MIEYTAGDFNDLCRDGSVSSEISTIEETRKQAVKRFWLLLLGGIVLGILVALVVIGAGWPTVGLIVGMIVIGIGIFMAVGPLSAAKQKLKHPVLTTLARRGGMEYVPSGFEPPVYPAAARILFGRVSTYVFTDLFHGVDEEGRRFAIYEGTLSRRQGKNTVQVFTGQIYAFQRRTTGHGQVGIVPDAGILNFFKPSGMERVKFDSDPDFEKKFEVYATEQTAGLSVVGSDVRRELLQLREAGRVYVYVGPEDVLVALWGKNRFEPGSMFRSRPGEERVKLMFDDVCASVGILKRVRTLFA
ncbi:MAG TPA: DUF3137 domain-containing protein [Allosphingosinicella sp.]|jgi:hypothetical protein|nr:DUF3137 domain-containing protein [Allosphingosinicella sp.]